MEICIDRDRCLAGGGDCPPLHACNDNTYRCEAVQLCTQDTDCGTQAYCNQSGACLPLGRCRIDEDCAVAAGERCGNDWRCTPGSQCGGQVLTTTLVQPNILFVLDRSGSMNECLSDGTVKWTAALSAIRTVASDHGDSARFGLSTFPPQCSDVGPCSYACDFQACSANTCVDQCVPGGLDVPIGTDSQSAITDMLATRFPGGGTPTGPTMWSIANNPGFFGLPSIEETIERENFVIMVTDGKAFDCHGSGTGSAQVNDSLGLLSGLTKPVRTFVVGFDFAQVSDDLNCHAYFGGTARTETCPNINEDNCGWQRQACYYEANDAAALSGALQEIARAAFSCTYTLDQAPPNQNDIHIFFRDGDDYETVQRGPDTWDLSSDGANISFYGASCEQLRQGEVDLEVVFGCPNPKD